MRMKCQDFEEVVVRENFALSSAVKLINISFNLSDTTS